MRRETAYKLAGRKHQHSDALAEQVQHHELRLATQLPGARDQALALLLEVPHLRAEPGEHPASLMLSYDLAHHSLTEIEALLQAAGLVLDDSLLSRLKRSIAHFVEETQARNASTPQRLIKQSNQVYVSAYAHHPHGDHDETPPELREDR